MKQLTILLLTLCALLLPSCSLETARQTRLNSPANASRSAPLQARPESECRVWDGVHVWGDWTAGGLSAVAAGAGTIAAASDPGKTKDAMLATGVVTAALSAVALGVASKSAATWTEQCSQ